jgi:hypothetical protein
MFLVRFNKRHFPPAQTNWCKKGDQNFLVFPPKEMGEIKNIQTPLVLLGKSITRASTRNQSHGHAGEEQEEENKKPKRRRRRWTLSIPVPTGP